jgi:hypothetical protein
MTLNNDTLDAARCPLCGQSNECQRCTVTPYKGPCWCDKVEIPDGVLARVPVEFRNRACICQNCIGSVRLE